MRILAVDTSGPYAGAALMEDGVVTHEIAACHGLTHSQTSLPMIDQALAAANLTPADMDLFAAVTGPGSFTGVRIGVCEAKGLAHAAGKTIVGVDCAAFRFEGGDLPERVLPDDALPLSEFLSRLPKEEKCLFLGDGLKVHLPAIRQALGDRVLAAPANMAYLRATSACVIAEKRADEAVEPMALEPTYLRAPQAERERNARLAQSGGE